MPKSRDELNKRLGSLLHLRRSTARSTIADSAGAVASTSNSVSQSTESTSNSIAFSRVLKLLKDIDISGEIAEGLENPLVDYIGRIESYANHRLPHQLDAFEIFETQWQHVSLAAEFAKYVHKINEPSLDTAYSSGNLLGSMRSFCMHTTTIDQRTTHVVALRATRRLMEWAVNSNVDPVECGELGAGLQCHRGLLRVARNMQSSIASELARALNKQSAQEATILFTGHSSGGAIAQFIFAYMHGDSPPLAILKSDDRITSIDCVTFGCPPISKPAMPRPSTKCSMFVSFINEGDPAALAQQSYMRSLIEAWTKPITNDNWPIPSPYYVPSGDQVALRCEVDENGNVEAVSALLVDVETLGTVLFGDLAMHSMSIYESRIHRILDQASIPRNPFQDPH